MFLKPFGTRDSSDNSQTRCYVVPGTYCESVIYDINRTLICRYLHIPSRLLSYRGSQKRATLSSILSWTSRTSFHIFWSIFTHNFGFRHNDLIITALKLFHQDHMIFYKLRIIYLSLNKHSTKIINSKVCFYRRLVTFMHNIVEGLQNDIFIPRKYLNNSGTVLLESLIKSLQGRYSLVYV